MGALFFSILCCLVSVPYTMVIHKCANMCKYEKKVSTNNKTYFKGNKWDIFLQLGHLYDKLFDKKPQLAKKSKTFDC